MTEQESFDQIDVAIDSFKAKEGFRKGIKVSKTPPSDWLVFNWRQLTWIENGINYVVEVYPTFDDKEGITGWNLYAAASYDANAKRYYSKKTFSENTTIEAIANNAEMLLSKSYAFLRDTKKEEIPFAVELK